MDSDVALFGELTAGTREFYALQKRYIHKDGQVVWGNLRVSLIRNASGAPQFVIGMVEDVTERKQIEQQYLQAQKMDSIGRLAGGIAHDFNNLLTVILGNTDMLLEEVSGEHPFVRNILGNDQLVFDFSFAAAVGRLEIQRQADRLGVRVQQLVLQLARYALE